MQAEKVIEWIAAQQRSGGYSHHDSVRFHWEPSGTWATVKREGTPPWVSKELSSLSGKGAFDVDGRAYAVFRSFAGWQIARWSGGTRKKHLSYKRVIKPEDKEIKTFSPSPDLQKHINDYVKLVQQKVDKGTSADDAFKERPDYDNLTGDDLLELFLNNPSLGMNPMKELNYLDLFGLLQQVIEKIVWTEAVKWWGKQKTEVDKKKKEKTDRDTTETVVERPMAAKWKHAAKKRELEGPDDEYYYTPSPFDEKTIEYIAQRNLKSLANHYLRYAPKDFEGNFAGDFEYLAEVMESNYDDPRLVRKKGEYKWNLKPDVRDFLEKAEQKLIKAWSDRELKKIRKDPDYKFFATLGELFTIGPVSPAEMKYVNYRPYKNYIKLNDSEGMLGHMHANTSHSSLLQFMKQNGIKNPTVEMFIDFLKRRGANLLKKRKPRKHYPPLYD